jgi:hypothetical protein
VLAGPWSSPFGNFLGILDRCVRCDAVHFSSDVWRLTTGESGETDVKVSSQYWALSWVQFLV